MTLAALARAGARVLDTRAMAASSSVSGRGGVRVLAHGAHGAISVRLAARRVTLSARRSGMIRRHVGNRAGRRPIHVADHHLLDRGGRHPSRTTLDAAAQARAAPGAHQEGLASSPSRNQVNPKVIEALEKNSPLGRVLAAALANRDRGREIMMERVEDTGRHVVHELERFLNSLGTIASISPLLGLLGTVTGIIRAFNAVMLGGMGDPRMLAGGISEALITTAGGLAVAIPSFIAYRYLRGKVERIVIEMEKIAVNFADSLGAEPQAGEADGGIARTA